jgi:threonine synthase
MDAYIFVPRDVPASKLAQVTIYGAKVAIVDGDYDDAYYLCEDAVEEFGWYDRNCAVNPVLIEGKKTCGLELAEQFKGDVPEWLSVAVGDGCTVAGVYKGLRQMHELGIIARVPRILAVQARGASPIADAFHERGPVRPVTSSTGVDAIAVGRPRNSHKALRAVAESGGTFVTVDDEEVLAASSLLAATSGLFGEPGGVAGLAGVIKARRDGTISAADRVVHILTGSGLKATQAVAHLGSQPFSIPPNLDAVRATLVADSQRPDS